MLLALSACAPGSEESETPAVGLRATPAGHNVEVEAYPRSFRVVDKLGDEPASGEGHIHFYLDVEKIPTTAGRPAVTSDDSSYHATATATHVWKDLEPGKYMFGVQLVNNDHTPLEPPVTAQQEVAVE